MQLLSSCTLVCHGWTIACWHRRLPRNGQILWVSLDRSTLDLLELSFLSQSLVAWAWSCPYSRWGRSHPATVSYTYPCQGCTDRSARLRSNSTTWTWVGPRWLITNHAVDVTEPRFASSGRNSNYCSFRLMNYGGQSSSLWCRWLRTGNHFSVSSSQPLTHFVYLLCHFHFIPIPCESSYLHH